MGTQYSVRVLTDRSLTDQEQAQLGEGIFAVLDKVDRLMSSYRQNSEISGINRAEVGSAYRVSLETFEVLVASREMYHFSEGAFDISLSPLIDLWGFGAKKEPREIPTQEALNEVRTRIGLDKLVFDKEGQTIRKQAPLELNVSAIAKGYAVDLVAEFLDRQGYQSYLVEVGGEIYARGLKRAEKPWVLGIEAPDFPGRKAITTVPLRDLAMATSGDYRNYIERDGVRYSHTIDPATLSPVLHRLASVSVISDQCAKADALATALMVMGEKKGIEFARQNGLDALFILRESSGFDIVTTGRFSRLVN